MRTVGVVVLVSGLLALAACAQKGKVLLSDAELDRVKAGTDLCRLFGVIGPCVGSFLEVFDPGLPPNPSCGSFPGTTTNCVSSLTSSPIPPSGTVTLQQSLRVDGPFGFQSVSQTNTVTNVGTPRDIKLFCFMCGQPQDFNRAPGRW